MLDLTGIKEIVERSLLEYICDKFELTGSDYITFIGHDDKLYDVDIIYTSYKVYDDIDTLNEETELDAELSDFDPVDDDKLSKYFKLYLQQ